MGIKICIIIRIICYRFEQIKKIISTCRCQLFNIIRKKTYELSYKKLVKEKSKVIIKWTGYLGLIKIIIYKVRTIDTII